MAKAKKLPSGQWRTLVFDCFELMPCGSKKRKYESFTADTKKESEYLAAEFSLNKKKREKTIEWTVGEALDAYIKSSDSVLSITTLNRYRTSRKNAFQGLMNLKIKSLNDSIMQTHINNELKRKPNNKKGQVSPNTVCNDYGLILSAIRRYAPEMHFNVRLPQKETKIKQLITPDVLLGAFKDTDIELPALIAMWLSFSLSEIRGLKWTSIIGDTIQIDQVVVTVGRESVEKKNAKNNTRKRVHKIPDYIFNLLNATEHTSEYIVPMTGAAIYKSFQRILKANNLPHMTFHDLRHVNASVMHLLNIPDKYAQERGGWKTDHIMKSVYTHTFSDERLVVDSKIDQYFNSMLENQNFK